MGRKESEEVSVFCSAFRLSLIWVALDLLYPRLNVTTPFMAMFSAEFAPHSGYLSLLLPLQA